LFLFFPNKRTKTKVTCKIYVTLQEGLYGLTGCGKVIKNMFKNESCCAPTADWLNTAVGTT